MPSYEKLILADAKLSKKALGLFIRFACREIINQGGVVRNLNYYPPMQLPHRIRKNQTYHYAANPVNVEFDFPSQKVAGLKSLVEEQGEALRVTVVKQRSPLMEAPEFMKKGCKNSFTGERLEEIVFERHYRPSA
eukprot:Nk52_evm2s1181 gene=Nk52_evmTU2s1181